MSLPHWIQTELRSIKHGLWFLGYSVWEYWLGKTKKTIHGSTIEVVGYLVVQGVKKFLPKKEGVITMEKDIALGSVGSVDISFSAGLAKVALDVAVPGQVGVSAGAFVQCDSVALMNALFAAIESKLPASADPIAETVKAILIQAVQAIK